MGRHVSGVRIKKVVAKERVFVVTRHGFDKILLICG